jgi:hypothetical protein
MSIFADRTILPTGHLMIIDEKRGVGMLCDPLGGCACPNCGYRHPYWNVSLGFQLGGTHRHAAHSLSHSAGIELR